MKQIPLLVRSENLNENRKDTQKIENNEVGQTIKFQIKQPIQIQKQCQIKHFQEIFIIHKRNHYLQNNNVKRQLEQLIGQSETKDAHIIEVQSEIDNLQYVICWSNTPDKIMSQSEKCGYMACQDCWKQWLQTKLQCPLC